ncbi:MFS transporter [Oceanobacillus rekensis]|uniref:MFS transporter n=1 Tax=Oceanobacillus rekensis TaxID=937927 RepID=UPI000B43ECA9|nr:aromatic acid/H+ symport family MFS transporter [Oceanobacillus rekensis]
MRDINVREMLDEAKFNRFHGMVLFWCAFAIIFDGYDLIIFGSVVPVLIEEWGITSNQAGMLGSAALVGMMLGAFFFGPLADKVGRKNIIIFCIALFSIFTFFIGFATDIYQFGIYRFIAGLGLGGVMPNAIALMSEYAPKKLKSTLVSIMFSGYSVGGIAAAGLAIFLIPKLGWESLFFIGGIPLLTLPFMYKTLPDSPYILMAKQENTKVETILTKVNPAYGPIKGDRFTVDFPEHEKGNSVAKLFTKGRAFSTSMLWIAFFMCLLMIYGLNTWLPGIMKAAGYPLDSSILFLLVLNIGAIFGAIGGGWIADQWNPKKVLILFFILAAVSLSLLGFTVNIYLLYTLVAIAGATTIGTQIIANAYATQYYPSEIRSSAVGWALGVGRIGAIVGPLMGGMLLTLALPIYQNFLAFAIPGIMGAIAMFFVQEQYSVFGKVGKETPKPSKVVKQKSLG